MSWRKPRLGAQDLQVMEETTLFRGFYHMVKYRLRHRLFAGGWSDPVERELFKRGSSVAVLAFDPHRQRVALVEQFRVGALQEPFGPWLLEVVAGMVDKSESPEQVARRELLEEAGIDCGELQPIMEYLSSPGGSSEKLHLFLAFADLDDKVGGIHGLDVEGEDILVHILSVDEAFEALQASRCKDAATTICLQWLQLNLSELVENSPTMATG